MNNEGLTPLFSLLGIVLIYLDLHARRKLQKEEFIFRKDQYKEEKAEREERTRWIQRESLRLTQVAEPLAKNIANEMKKDVRWASEVLERAKLGPYTQSIFGERSGHFREEKESIAEYFVGLLFSRCKHFVAQGEKVYLLIDSGTTLYPFFDKIVKLAVRCHQDKEDWINNLHIATNNLPGIQRLMEVGRINPNNRYSPLAIDAELFPGTPLAIYAAVTGERTNKEVEDFCNAVRAQRNSRIISLVVGNWIRVRRSTPACPVPLARGEGHLSFKQKLINNADEIYIITPLGKVFINRSLKEINEALGLNEAHIDPDRQPYSEVTIDDNKARNVKIVTTSRPRNRVLSEISTRLHEILHSDNVNLDEFDKLPSDQLPHILRPFDDLPENWFLQIETEFPHPHTRRDDFTKKYFSVPERQLTERN